MTFKHVKFEDSPTMRALEKVAVEKGLVKPETLNKKASVVKKADLAPTENLMENIVKLCNGLRQQGLVKDAEELETNYLQYKQAQTIYDTSKEEGEDLVDAAHPDGSHKLEDVDSTEAVIETILDQHKKDKEVVEKDPKGKLTDTASAIGAVKKVLGQYTGSMPTEPPPGQAKDMSGVRRELEAANADFQVVVKLAQGGGLWESTLNSLKQQGAFMAWLAKAPSPDADTINKAKDNVDSWQTALHPNLLHNILPDWLNKGVSSDELWKVMDQKLDSAKSHLSKAVTALAEAIAKGSSRKERMQQLMALGQVDPEAIKKGKEAMVLALQLIDRGMAAFLGVYYDEALEQRRPGLELTRKQLADLIGKVQATGDDNFPTQLLKDCGNSVWAAKKFVDDQRAFYSADDMKDKVDAGWWRKFNYAASLVGQGQSMSWGAANAISDGDLSGLQFHAAHISSDEVMSVINANLVRPLTQVKSEMSGINVDQIKNARYKQLFPQLVQDLDAAVTSAQTAANNVMSQSDQNLRVIHPSKIAALFGPPLDKDNRGAGIFNGVNSLEALKAKCGYVVGIYRGYLDTIKRSVG